MNHPDRDDLRRAFLEKTGWGDASVDALPGDASFRRYFRLGGERPAMLMDAPPPHEDVRPFIAVARHLNALGLSAPAILAADDDLGFAVIEDFGDATYTRLIAGGADPEPLYELAVDVLAHLHTHDDAAAIGVPPYDESRLLEEASLLVDWYRPKLLGADTPEDVRASYLAAWSDVIRNLPAGPETLVLRDYHVDNLMIVDGRDGVGRCGLLDFQDALIGHPAYDLMSLVEDARRDVPDDLRARLLERYVSMYPAARAPGFEDWFSVLAAQRHAKVAGIFVRLLVRDGKAVYLPHVPRVVRLLKRALGAPPLAPVAAWFERHLSELGQPLPD